MLSRRPVSLFSLSTLRLITRPAAGSQEPSELDPQDDERRRPAAAAAEVGEEIAAALGLLTSAIFPSGDVMDDVMDDVTDEEFDSGIFFFDFAAAASLFKISKFADVGISLPLGVCFEASAFCANAAEDDDFEARWPLLFDDEGCSFSGLSEKTGREPYMRFKWSEDHSI